MMSMNSIRALFLITLLTLSINMLLATNGHAAPISGCGECINTYICPDSITCKTQDCGMKYHVFRGTPSIDGPNLILVNHNKMKKVVITANTLFFPSTMNPKNITSKDSVYVVYVKEYKKGIAQAVEVFDARHAVVNWVWCPSEKRYRQVVKQVAVR
jgi:hypothetical protein